MIEKPGLDRFISSDPRILLGRTRNPPLPLMIGVNKDETAFFYPMVADAFSTSDVYFHEKELIPRFLEAGTNIKGHMKDRVIPSILFNYFNGVDLKNLTSMANRFINMSTDALYVSCIDDTIKTYWRSQSPIYQYLFQYTGSNSMLKLLMNNPNGERISLYPPPVCHGDELFYLFNLRILGLREENLSDLQISHRMTTLWTDFAKVGFAPRITSVEFPPWHKFDADKLSFYRIGFDLSPSWSGYRQSQAYFWTHQMKNASNNANVHPLLRPSSAAMLVHGSSTTSTDIPFKILAFTLIGVSICLLALVIFLLVLLFVQRRSQIFRAATPVTSSAGSTLY